MASPLDDAPLVEDDDLVHPVQAGEAVGDEEGPVALGEFQQVGGQGVGRRRVEVLGRLVEDQNPELGEQVRGHATRWRWPPESRSPADPDSGGQPCQAAPRASRPRPTRAPTRPRARRRSPSCFSVAGSRPGSSRRGAGSARPARRPGAPRRKSAVQAARRRASSRRCRRAGSARGHRPTSICPPRSARPAPPAAPARGRDPPPAGPTGPFPGSRPTPRASGAWGPGRSTASASGESAPRPETLASMAANTRPAAVRAALQRLGPGRQKWSNQLEGGEGDQGEDGQERAVEVAAVGGARPEGQGAPAGQPRQGRGQAEADAGGARPVASRRPHGRSATVIRPTCSAGAPYDGELGLPPQSDRRPPRSSPRAEAWQAPPPAVPAGRSARAPQWRDEQGGQQHGAAPGSRTHMTATVALPTRQATAKGG